MLRNHSRGHNFSQDEILDDLKDTFKESEEQLESSGHFLRYKMEYRRELEYKFLKKNYSEKKILSPKGIIAYALLTPNVHELDIEELKSTLQNQDIIDFVPEKMRDDLQRLCNILKAKKDIDSLIQARNGEMITNEEIQTIKHLTSSIFINLNNSEGVNLAGLDLSQCIIPDDFESLNLSYADLHGANFANFNQAGSSTIKMNFYGAYLYAANFSKANLQGACLQHAELAFAILNDSNLRDTQLDFARLWGAELKGANLSNANVHWSDLEGANLKNTNLKSADFSFSNLNNSDLTGATIELTNFHWAKLRGIKRNWPKTFRLELPKEDMPWSVFSSPKLFESEAEFKAALSDFDDRLCMCTSQSQSTACQTAAEFIIEKIKKMPIQNAIKYLEIAVAHDLFAHRTAKKLKETVNSAVSKFFDRKTPLIQTSSQGLLRAVLQDYREIFYPNLNKLFENSNLGLYPSLETIKGQTQPVESQSLGAVKEQVQQAKSQLSILDLSESEICELQEIPHVLNADVLQPTQQPQVDNPLELALELREVPPGLEAEWLKLKTLLNVPSDPSLKNLVQQNLFAQLNKVTVPRDEPSSSKRAPVVRQILKG